MQGEKSLRFGAAFVFFVARFSVRQYSARGFTAGIIRLFHLKTGNAGKMWGI